MNECNDTDIPLTGSLTQNRDPISILLELKDLKETVKQLTIKEVKDALQLSDEVMEPVIHKIEQQFKLNRPPMEAEIKHAISRTKTMKEAAKFLGVSSATLKKYCRLYDENRMGVSDNFLSAGGLPHPL